MLGGRIMKFANILKEIENEYNIKVLDCKPAPRGFCAETYFIKTKDNMYFLKIFHNRRFAYTAISSIPALEYMAYSLPFVPAPFKTGKNLYHLVLQDTRIACLYEYLKGNQYQPQNGVEMVSYMSQIYKLKNPQFIRREDFKILHRNVINNLLAHTLDISDAIYNLIEQEHEMLYKSWNYYNKLSNILNKKNM